MELKAPQGCGAFTKKPKSQRPPRVRVRTEHDQTRPGWLSFLFRASVLRPDRRRPALPQRRHALGMQGIRTADRDHVSIGSDRPEQTVEFVDLVDGDSENKAIVRHGIPPPAISRTQPSAPAESIFLFQISEKQIKPEAIKAEHSLRFPHVFMQARPVDRAAMQRVVVVDQEGVRPRPATIVARVLRVPAA
jgi:hypothetical protein